MTPFLPFPFTSRKDDRGVKTVTFLTDESKCKTKIIKALMKEPLNQYGVHAAIGMDSARIKKFMREMRDGKFVKFDRDKKYLVTKKGSRELEMNGYFECSVDYSVMFQLNLTGNLTANADGKKAYLY